ncbi:hypothetical protein BJ508DRAFT_321741 [Ascobolus immersus RN42]|uniref:MYND-type domain-containing protein n=1 Tax=Ascobolus immersus RN42 TaxID=1160509 RepID=A0A3N4IL64_ASCIM|nr:hypothetical protein BJ508DRAFT_321741 [Ascobolus immersus RN42]
MPPISDQPSQAEAQALSSKHSLHNDSFNDLVAATRNTILNEQIFPSFDDLEAAARHNRRPFAYIGDITSYESFLRLVITLKDPKTHQPVVVAFYDDGRGTSISRNNRDLTEGNTVMIFGARPKTFLDGRQGIRIENEDLNNVLILPFSYDKLVAANERYLDLGKQSNACSSCKTRVADTKVLSGCGRCKVTRYCNKECQTADWDKHKLECRAMGEIRTLFRIELPARA